MITYQELFMFCNVLIGLANLILTIRNGKK